MNTTTLQPTATSLQVGMGQIVLLRDAGVAKTVLGSCIGLVLYHKRRQIGAVGHIVLPDSAGRPGLPGKFADTAVPHMIDLLQAEEVHYSGLVAKMAGGANMFGSTGPLQIGDANIEAVEKALEDLRIPIQGRHIAGAKGRRLEFDRSTGEVTIDIVGEPTVVL